MRKWHIAVAAGLILSVIFSFVSFADNCGNIRQEVLRLHVLANSDSKEDQELKMKIRDQLVAHGAGILDGAENESEAAETARLHIETFKRVAEDTARREGYDYTIKVEVADCYFDTRAYEQVTLPAGWYEALRVVIGKGEGQNWWCVMFPPMCIPAAEESAELDGVLSDEQLEIVENGPKYEIKFKSVEIFEKIKKQLSEWFD